MNDSGNGKEIVIPILPCASIDETLDFYTVLGFHITYRQKSPNVYAVVQRGGIQLHFFTMKGYEAKNSYSTCYIITDDVDDLFNVFTNALKQKYGKLPTRGLPRISEIRDKASGVREFIFTDPGGNCIRIGKQIAGKAASTTEEQKAINKLLLAMDFAMKSGETPEEYIAVANVLDTAIKNYKYQPCLPLLQVMLHRADIAIAMADKSLAKEILEQIKSNEYFIGNQANFSTTWNRIHDIEQKL